MADSASTSTVAAFAAVTVEIIIDDMIFDMGLS
jgi:hypothetical protein